MWVELKKSIWKIKIIGKMKVRDMKKDQTNFVWSIRNLYILQVGIAVRICQIMRSGYVKFVFIKTFFFVRTFSFVRIFSSSKFASTYCYIHAAVGAIQGFRDQNAPRGFRGLEIIPLLRISLVEISRKFPNTFFLWWNSVLYFDDFWVDNVEDFLTHFSFGKTAYYSLIIFW